MSPSSLHGVKGDTVCRPPDWFDVARFFFLNYGLHAFTVMLTPGGDTATIIFGRLLGLLMPFYGHVIAAKAITIFSRREPDQLRTALKADALCMVVPGDPQPSSSRDIAQREIHGQYPASLRRSRRGAKDPEQAGPHRWSMITVPKSFIVVPPVPGPVTLSCNYSVLAAVAAIVQVLSGTMELYRASERQIPRFGYAAYSLTVVPYVLMSVFNLVGAMCQPQYPTMFLVEYRGPVAPTDTGDEVRLLPLTSESDDAKIDEPDKPAIGGAVGEAYGELGEESTTIGLSNFSMILHHILIALLVIAPYVVIQLMTGFATADSTVAQRAWTMLWLASGQAWVLSAMLCKGLGLPEPASMAVHVPLMAVVFTGTIGGFVVVAQMILQDEVCVVI